MRINTIVLTFLLILVFTDKSHANNYEPQKIVGKQQLDLAEERIMGLIGSSKSYRRKIGVGRAVAGRSLKDMAHFNEFIALMDNQKETDYFELIENLEK